MSTEEYLTSSANIDEFSSSSEIAEIIRLAKLDLQEGIMISQLVFWCCQYYPRKKSLQKLIELGMKTEAESIYRNSPFVLITLTESEKSVVKSVFDFQTPIGFNCLIILFQMATR